MDMESKHDCFYIATRSACCYRLVIARCPKAAKCDLCQSMWVKGLITSFHTRKLRSGDIVEQAILWSLGSSKRDTGAERAALGHSWELFRTWMNEYSDWKPIFRVVEVGARGKRLHIHFIATSYIDHEVVLEAWRSAVGESANVNFSYIAGTRSEDILGYLVKYLTKDGCKYSWLGSFYKAGAGERVPALCKHGNSWEFLDIPRPWEVGEEQYYYR